MSVAKRTTINFDPELYEGLRERAAKEGTSISEIVNEAVRQTLIDYEQDDEDLAELDRRRGEGNIPFEDAVAELKSRGLL
jgi:metal-responsive CopG/Arc/MetJ family transcriptional regulator